MQEFNKSYWTTRYRKNTTGWDIGFASTPLVAYFLQLTNKDLKILIPGAGNAYEAEWLWMRGFKNLHVLDISEKPLKNLKKRIPNIPDSQLICGDFFEHNSSYDLIVEQTFFCALNPTLRKEYERKMKSLLSENGKLIGLMFDAPLNTEHPPFGGCKEEYQNLFKNWKKATFEACYNSIIPRQGKELFVILKP